MKKQVIGESQAKGIFRGALKIFLKPIELFGQDFEKHGDFVCYNLPGFKFINTRDPGLINFAIKKAEFITIDSPANLAVRDILEEGLLTSREKWEIHRDLVRSNVCPQKIKSSNSKLHSIIDGIEVQLKEFSVSENHFSLTEIVRNYTLSVIGKSVFGHSNIENIKRIQIQIDRAFDASIISSLYGRPTITSLFFVPFKIAKLTRKRKLYKFCKLVFYDQETVKKSMLVARLHESVHAGQISEREALNEIANMVLTGYKTTTCLITGALYELIQAPHVLNKLKAEIEHVDVGNLDTESIKKLTYLDWIVKESLRLYPAVPILMRQITKDTSYKNMKLPKGRSLNLALYFLHRNPKYWKDPLAFFPERWKEKHLPSAFIPFSTGKRFCAGRELAIYETKLFIARILKKWHFELMPGWTYEHRFGEVLYIRPEIQVKVTPANTNYTVSSSNDNEPSKCPFVHE